MTDFSGKAAAEGNPISTVPHEAEIPCEVEQELVPIVENPQLESKEKVAIILRAIHRQEMFSGPIPSPRVMAEYEKILPGSADRILCKFEEQSTHRMQLEKTVIPAQVRQSSRGQHYALIIGLFLILIALYALYLGHQVLTGIIVSVTLVAAMSLFIGGKISMRRDLKEKSDDPDSQ